MPLKKYHPFTPVTLTKSEKVKAIKQSKMGAQSKLSKIRTRKFFAIKKGVLATIRTFKTPQEAQKYIEITKAFETFVTQANPCFELMSKEFLFKKGNEVYERVFTALNLEELGLDHRYRQFLIRRISKKINYYEFLLGPLIKAGQEFRLLAEKFSKNSGIQLDYASNNILIIDYNEKSKKPVLMFVDILHPNLGGSKRT